MAAMSFSSIIGHEDTIRRLRAVIRNGRLANGYIFAGPVGVGKTRTAKEFARAILCEQGEDDACWSCVSCRKFEHGNHAGFEQIAPEGAGQQIKIQQIRELQRRLAVSSADGDHRVVLLEPADRMRPTVANAFLKTLEEPPAGVVLVLITAQPSMLLDTIISRCQMVRFAPVGRDEIRRMLVERYGAAPEAAMLAAAMSDGSPGRAKKLFEGTIAAERDDVLDSIMMLTETNSPDLVARLLKKIGKGAVKTTEQRRALRELLTLMLYLFRDILTISKADEGYPLYSADRRDAIRDAAELFDTPSLLEIIDLLVDEIGLIDGYVDIEMMLDDLVGRIAQIKESRSISTK